MKYTSQSIEFIKYTDGRGVNSVVEYYYATATENATLPKPGSDAWKRKIEDTGFSAVNKYLWNYEKIEFTFGDPSTTVPGLISIWGKEIDEIYEFYMLNNSEAVPSDAPYLDQNGEIQYPNKEWKQYTSNQNIPVPTEDNRYLWNREITLYTDKTAYNSNVACVAVHGGALYSMSLDNDSDVIVTSPSGDMVSEHPIVNITTYKGDKIIFDGTINVTTNNCDVRELDGNKRSYEIIPNNNENAGSATFEWKISDDNEKVLTKTFNFKKITSIVDYDLVVSQTTINKSKGDASISVSIHKKETGKPIQTLTPSRNGEVLVKYQLYGDNTEKTLDGGTLEIEAVWMGGSCPVRLVSEDGFTWDEETIEIVDDGLPGSNGATITNTETQYCQIDSSYTSVPSDAEWSPEQPTYSEGKNIWTRLYFSLSDGTKVAGEPTLDKTLNTITDIKSDVSNLEDDVGSLENDYSGFKDEASKKFAEINDKVGNLPKFENIIYKGDIQQNHITDNTTGLTYIRTTVPAKDGGTVVYDTYDGGDYFVFGKPIGSGSFSNDKDTANTAIIIEKEGLLKAKNAWIYGTVYATDGEFTGSVTAKKGYIGGDSGWVIKTGCIYRGKDSYGSPDEGIYIGVGGINVGGETNFFKVTKSGGVLIGNAEISNGLIVNYITLRGADNQNYWTLSTQALTSYSGFSLKTSGEFEGTLQGAFKSVNGNRESLMRYDKVEVAYGSYRIGMSINGTIPTLSGGGITTTRNISFMADYALLDGTWKYNDLGAASNSDRNLKNSITPMSDQYEALFDALQPCVYRYNHGTSNRLHTGFIAQEVLAAMNTAGISTQDFAGYVELKDTNPETGEEEITCALRYEEFIALAVHKIQKLTPRISATEQEILSLKQEISALRAEIQNLKNS